MNELKKKAKNESATIKRLAMTILILTLILIIVIIFYINFINRTSELIATPEPSSPVIDFYFVSEIFLICIGFFAGIAFWYSSRFPNAIITPLVFYYNGLGYSTKQSMTHILKVSISPKLYFKIKLNNYKRTSGEIYLFYLESMGLPNAALEPEKFKKIAEHYFLKSNMSSQKFSTSCELEEVHERSLLLIQAIEEFYFTN
ncbi:MAG: hypothetical protein ACFFD2_17700 [Promethearchaeota archaeon]